MPYTGQLGGFCPGTACRHLRQGVARQQIGLLTAYDQRRAGDGVPEIPQFHVFVRRAGVKGYGDGRVVVHAVAAIGLAPHHVLGQKTPLRVAVRTKGCADKTHQLLGRFNRRQARRLADIGADALERNGGHHRTDVVEHHAADRRFGQRGQHHANQPAHGGTDPVHRCHIEAGNERDHVGGVMGNGVFHRVFQPVAVAAPGHVGADHPIVTRQFGGKGVKVARAAGEAVHAYHHARIGGVAPLQVGHAMQARGTGALH